MTKLNLLSKLYGIRCAITCDSYLEDWDGDDETGAPIVRRVYKGMTEEDTKNVLKMVEGLIEDIKKGDE